MSRSADVAVAVALLSLVLTLPMAALGQPLPEELAPVAASGGRDLYLEVFINGRTTDLIAAFHERPDGVLTTMPDELERLGIRSGTAEAGERVALTAIPGVDYSYDEPTQILRISASDAARQTAAYAVAGAGGTEAMPTDPSGFGAFVNYTLFGSFGTDFGSMDDLFQGVSGAYDAYFYNPLGVLGQSGIARYSPDLGTEFIRLDSHWSRSDPATMISYRAGDLISGGLSWTRPVRLGGIQAHRDFKLRADLITRPLPDFSGSAAVPTTADIFIDNVKRQTVEIDDGPFVLNDLPATTGGGTAQVVLRDAQGQQIVTDLPFYASPNLLRQGLMDFSIEAGFPRYGFGDRSFDYADMPFGSITARYGSTDWLTLESHAEFGENLVNGGTGAAFTLGWLGEGSVAVAGSKAGGETGVQLSTSARLEWNDFSLFGRTQRTFGTYHDIASRSALDTSVARNPIDLRPPKVLEQINISLPLGFDPARISANYTRRVQADGDTQQILSSSLSRPLWGGVSLSVSGFADMEGSGDYGVFATLSIPLGGGRSGSAGLRASSGKVTAFAEASKPAAREPGSFGWRAQAAYGENTRVSAGATYVAPFAKARGEISQGKNRLSGTASLDGSVGIAGGTLFAANRVHDALGVVHAGAPDVEVFYENRPVGMTGQNGSLVIPYLRSYQSNRVSIDPSNLPVDVQVPSASAIVSPHARSGVTIDFGVETASAGALISLVSPSGEPVPVGSAGRLDGSDDTFMVGYDGEAYVEGLSARNTVIIRLPDRSSCTASFEFQERKGEQVWIRNIPCVAGTS